MQRVLIIGSPGCGKSYFARALSQVTGLPLHYLDCLYWQPGWVVTPKEEFLQKIMAVMQNDQWIIDGNYIGTLAKRLEYADCVFYLDFSTRVALRGERQRRGQKRDDLPSFLEEEYDPAFVKYIKDFRHKQRPRLKKLLKDHPNVQVITFKHRFQMKHYLRRLAKLTVKGLSK